MKIWYLNHYAKPAEFGTPGRSSYLAKYLQTQGHDTLIVAASHHHTRIKPAPTEDIRNIRLYDGIKYLHFPTRYYSGNGLLRFLNMLDYARGISSLARYVEDGRIEKPDIIIASSVHIFVYPPAYRLAHKFKAKIIFEVRDIWPLSLIKVANVHRMHPLILWMSYIENNAYMTADAVVSLLPKAFEHMHSKGLKADKFFYIPNGVNAKEWEQLDNKLPDTHQTVFDECRTQKKLIILYAGAHGIPNVLDQIIDLKKVLGESIPPYHFILIGDGAEKEKLVNRAREEDIKFMSFLPRITKKEIISALRQADIGFIGAKKLEIYKYGVSPNKLFDYFITGKPVLNAMVAGNNPVEEAKAGLSVEPYNPHQLDHALREFISMGSEGRNRMGARGKQYALENLEWSVLGKRYEDLCESLLGNKETNIC